MESALEFFMMDILLLRSVLFCNPYYLDISTIFKLLKSER